MQNTVVKKTADGALKRCCGAARRCALGNSRLVWPPTQPIVQKTPPRPRFRAIANPDEVERRKAGPRRSVSATCFASGMRLSMMSSSRWGRGGLAPSQPAHRDTGCGPPIKEGSLQSIAPRGGTLHDRKYAVLVSQEMIASTPRTAAAAAWDGGLGLLKPARSAGAA